MRRALRTLVCAALLACLCAPALALTWPDNAPQPLRSYVEAVNESLASLGERPINSVFESYPGFAVLGVTEADMAEVPEQAEITVYFARGELHYLQLRVTEGLNAFPALAAALIHAASPEAVKLSDILRETTRYLERVRKTPDNSFADRTDTMQGDSVRAYYAYEPYQYASQNPPVPTLQVTVVFPLPGFGNPVYVTPVPGGESTTYNGEGSPEWQGSGTPRESLSTLTEGEEEPELHLVITLTPTPEPEIEW